MLIFDNVKYLMYTLYEIQYIVQYMKSTCTWLDQNSMKREIDLLFQYTTGLVSIYHPSYAVQDWDFIDVCVVLCHLQRSFDLSLFLFLLKIFCVSSFLYFILLLWISIFLKWKVQFLVFIKIPYMTKFYLSIFYLIFLACYLKNHTHNKYIWKLLEFYNFGIREF